MRYSDIYNRQSLIFKVNIATIVVISAIFVSFYIDYASRGKIQSGRDKLINTSIPASITLLSALRQISGMELELFRYMSGTADARHNFYSHLDNYKSVIHQLKGANEYLALETSLNRSLKTISETVEDGVFRFKPETLNMISEMNSSITKNYVEPIDNILIDKGAFILERARSKDSKNEFMSEDIDRIRYNSAAHKNILMMSSYLKQYMLNDQTAERKFYKTAFDAEDSLSNLLETQTSAKGKLIRNEISRLFTGFRDDSIKIMDMYDPALSDRSYKYLHEILENEFKKSKNDLDRMSKKTTKDIAMSISSIHGSENRKLALDYATKGLVLVIVLGYTFFVKNSFIDPIKRVSNKLGVLRQGKRDVSFITKTRTQEIIEIEEHLENFQIELTELDELRDEENREKEQEYLENLESAYKELKIKESELLKTNSDLEQSNIGLEQFVHIASHDMREPLKNISGLSSILKFQLASIENVPDSVIDVAEKISNNSVRSCMLIDDLRTLTKLQTDKLIKEEIDLNGVIKRIFDDSASVFKSMKGEAVIPEMPVIVGYPNLFAQIFENIIGNAIKYGSKPLKIELLFGEENTKYCFLFKSSMKGTLGDSANKLLLPFSRGANTDSKPGTGMGLAICKKIVELHKGEISIDGSVDNTFQIKVSISKLEVDPPHDKG